MASTLLLMLISCWCIGVFFLGRTQLSISLSRDIGPHNGLGRGLEFGSLGGRAGAGLEWNGMEWNGALVIVHSNGPRAGETSEQKKEDRSVRNLTCLQKAAWQ